jgi:hypothetical protein
MLGLVLLIMAGCVDYTEELWLNKDGSGNVKMLIGVLTNYENQKEINRLLDQPGITLISKSVYRKDNYTYYKLEFRFKSLEAFNSLNDQVSNADFFGRITLNKEKDGTISMRRQISLGSMNADEDEIEQLFKSMNVDNLKWRYKMHLPWKIVSSNAAPGNVDYKENTVSWEYQIRYLWNKSQIMTAQMKKAFPLLPVILLGVAILIIIISLIWWGRHRRKSRIEQLPEATSEP